MTVDYDELAQKHGVSTSVVRHLADALQAGNGTQAQFNHPELGGMGQWMPNMIMVGDMFNSSLKAKVDALCRDIVSRDLGIPQTRPSMTSLNSNWWKADYGNATASGGQNNIRYVYFSDSHHLIIKIDEEQFHYDTKPHHIVGVSQQQTNTISNLIFHTSAGKTLSVVDFKSIDP